LPIGKARARVLDENEAVAASCQRQLPTLVRQHGDGQILHADPFVEPDNVPVDGRAEAPVVNDTVRTRTAAKEIGVGAEDTTQGIVAGSAVERVVALTTPQVIAAAAAVEVVTAPISPEGVVAGAAFEHVRCRVAVDHVVQFIAGGAERVRPEQGQDLDAATLAGQIERHPAVGGVSAFASVLDDEVVGVIDIVDIVAGAADQRVCTGQSFEPVIAVAAVEQVAAIATAQRVGAVETEQSIADAVKAGQ
jgi:hypothetical protein